MKKKIIFCFLSLLSFSASAVDFSKAFNFDGQLLDPVTQQPKPGPVSLLVQIYDPAVGCLIYEETHATVTLNSDDGTFSIKVGPDGGGTRSSASVDGGLTWSHIFQNDVQVRASGTNCTGGYTAAAGDGRKMRVSVDGTALTPDYALSPAPWATVAQTLQGKTPGDFVKTSGSSTINGNLKIDNSNELQLSNATNYVALKAAAGLTSNLTWTLPASNGTSGQVLSTDGSGTLSWSSAGSGISSLNSLSVATQTFATGSAGVAPAWNSGSSIHTLNIPLASGSGVTSGTISKTEYDSFAAKLSAVVGSPLTNGQIWVGDGSNAAAAVLMSGDVTIDNTGLTTIAANAITGAKIFDGTVATADLASASVTDAKIVGMSVTKLNYGPTEYFTYQPSGSACAPGETLQWDGSRWMCAPGNPGPEIRDADGNTGIQTEASANEDKIRFRTAGTERMVITDAGYIGVGTNAPATHLHINGLMKLQVNAAVPTACNASLNGVIALTSQSTLCICKSSGPQWVSSADGTTNCVW